MITFGGPERRLARGHYTARVCSGRGRPTPARAMTTQLQPKRAVTKALARTAAPAPAPPPSAMSLVRDALADTVEVVQAQFELAALEVREDARTAAKVAAGFAVGAALALLALGFFAAAAAFALALVLPAWAACLIVGAALAIAAFVATGLAKQKLGSHDFTPERTMASLQEPFRTPKGTGQGAEAGGNG
jgi:membrane protein